MSINTECKGRLEKENKQRDKVPIFGKSCEPSLPYPLSNSIQRERKRGPILCKIKAKLKTIFLSPLLLIKKEKN